MATKGAITSVKNEVVKGRGLYKEKGVLRLSGNPKSFAIT